VVGQPTELSEVTFVYFIEGIDHETQPNRSLTSGLPFSMSTVLVFVIFGTKMAKNGNGKEPKKGVFSL
jgi:hypothetical protein